MLKDKILSIKTNNLNIKKDKYLFNLTFFLAFFSILLVYSIDHDLFSKPNYFFNTTFQHIIYILIGSGLFLFASKIHYKYIVASSVCITPVIILLLLITLIKGRTIKSVNSSRWLTIPGIHLSFQPSTIASFIITIYCTYYTSKNVKYESLKKCIYNLFLPILCTILFILPANASSAIILLFSILIILFISKYPPKPLTIFICIILGSLCVFLLLAKIFPQYKIFNRLETWKIRIYNFLFQKKYNNNILNQISMAIKAILSGGWFGKGPGKSKYKHILPQANSDFIYAIIIEEYGVIGGVIILSTYMIILFRIIVIATNAPSYFTSLMVISLGLPIIIQALIHISVNISLIPVTGQNLPLISTGGTSICINFLRLGMIYNISKKKNTS